MRFFGEAANSICNPQVFYRRAAVYKQRRGTDHHRDRARPRNRHVEALPIEDEP
jgi:hypothetical protein